MFTILKKIFCCFCFNNNHSRSNISRTSSYYYANIRDKCRCESLGPPAWGTCDVCGAWKNY